MSSDSLILLNFANCINIFNEDWRKDHSELYTLCQQTLWALRAQSAQRKAVDLSSGFDELHIEIQEALI